MLKLMIFNPLEFEGGTCAKIAQVPFWNIWVNSMPIV